MFFILILRNFEGFEVLKIKKNKNIKMFIKKQQTDIEYAQNEFWTTFFAVSEQGRAAEKEIAKKMGGLPQVLNVHFKTTLAQLNKNGYVVKKAKKPQKKEIEEILQELYNEGE